MQAKQQRPGKRIRAAALLLALVAAVDFSGWPATVLADWQAWDFDRILRNSEQRYGSLEHSRPRILAWQTLIRDSDALPEREQIEEVNRFFNQQLQFSDDTWIWQQEDYWATPIESLIKGAGDCEDYALAKYFTLRRLGVPSERLRITYVKALSVNQAHMVLTYYATPTADPLVLDNLIAVIKPASQRKDLIPVYAFNAEGLYLPGAGGGKRSGDGKRLSRWQDVLTKMRAEGFVIGEG